MVHLQIGILLAVLVSTSLTFAIPVEVSESDSDPIFSQETEVESEFTITSTLATTKAIITFHRREREPDDILNWFFHHSFKKINQYFLSTLDLDEGNLEVNSTTSTASSSDPEPLANTTSGSKWKIRAVKVFLKLLLVILALVSAVLFVVSVLLFMLIAFVIIKFLCHIFQYCYENKKVVYAIKPRKAKINTSSSYHVTL